MNHAQVVARVAESARRAGRDVRSITLLAVTKGHPVPVLKQAFELGLTEFGENYVDEALPKILALGDRSITWHFIGRVQANKTRAMATHFHWVHGIDRLHVAERLSRQRPAELPPLNVCVQVNVADEASKAGVSLDDALPLLSAVAALPRLVLRGLMCMLPHECEHAAQHQGFARLRELQQAANAQGLRLDTLSMGMSADLEAAVAQGSTLLRVGTALFGPRG